MSDPLGPSGLPDSAANLFTGPKSASVGRPGAPSPFHLRVNLALALYTLVVVCASVLFAELVLRTPCAACAACPAAPRPLPDGSTSQDDADTPPVSKGGTDGTTDLPIPLPQGCPVCNVTEPPGWVGEQGCPVCNVTEPPESNYGGKWNEVTSRSTVLVSLMGLQSVSGFVLQRFERLLQRHVVVPVFLTMLVGAGGNAGSQTIIHLLEKRARGEMSMSFQEFTRQLRRESEVGAAVAAVLAAAAFVRVWITHGRHGGPMWLKNCSAIASSMLTIVFTSVCVGTMLPFLMYGIGLAPSASGPTVQVTMDVLGVIITCTVCSHMLASEYKEPSSTQKSSSESSDPSQPSPATGTKGDEGRSYYDSSIDSTVTDIGDF